MSAFCLFPGWSRCACTFPGRSEPRFPYSFQTAVYKANAESPFLLTSRSPSSNLGYRCEKNCLFSKIETAITEVCEPDLPWKDLSEHCKILSFYQRALLARRRFANNRQGVFDLDGLLLSQNEAFLIFLRISKPEFINENILTVIWLNNLKRSFLISIPKGTFTGHALINSFLWLNRSWNRSFLSSDK